MAVSASASGAAALGAAASGVAVAAGGAPVGVAVARRGFGAPVAVAIEMVASVSSSPCGTVLTSGALGRRAGRGSGGGAAAAMRDARARSSLVDNARFVARLLWRSAITGNKKNLYCDRRRTFFVYVRWRL